MLYLAFNDILKLVFFKFTKSASKLKTKYSIILPRKFFLRLKKKKERMLPVTPLRQVRGKVKHESSKPTVPKITHHDTAPPSDDSITFLLMDNPI